jgi:hypothetical protein
MPKEVVPDRTAEVDWTIRIVQLKRLLAEAAWRHPEDAWIKRAEALFPGFRYQFIPPCKGHFDASPQCDEAHAHGLRCGNESDICTRCGRTNAEHRIAWAAVE